MISLARKFPLRTHFLVFQKLANHQTSLHLRFLSTPTNSPGGLFRLSVIVPKKVSKLASTRTWLKRLTYDALSPTLTQQKLDVVVIFKPLTLKRSQLLKQELLAELINFHV